jgi:hypothetical protein
MHPAYPRAELQRRICEAVEAGRTLKELEREPDFPSAMTVLRWAKEDPAFAQRLKDARTWRRGVRAEARGAAAASFSAPLAEAFLLRVRRGEAMRDLVRLPGQPSRELLNAWKRQRPDFGGDLEAAKRFAQKLRPKRWERYDEAAADEIIVRLSRGEPLPQVLADKALPTQAAVRRWRRIRPDFDHAIEMAFLAGHRVRRRGSRKLTPELEAEIVERILAGASLNEISKLPGMPHQMTLYSYRRSDPAFARALRQASRERDDMLMDRALMLAERASEATVDEARAQIGSIHKQIARMAARRWG